MMMAAIHSDVPGPIMLAGSPLSYWAGVQGKNPMRYLGGLLGGTWLTSLAGDQNNPFLAAERMMSDLISTGLKNWGEARDLMTENLFLGIYGSPWLQTMVGLRADGTVARPRLERELSQAAAADRATAYLEQHLKRGGLLEATTRALIYVRLAEGSADERGFAALTAMAAELPASMRVGFARFKEVVKEQFMVLFLDEARAVAAIPALLPDSRKQRSDALRVLRRVLVARGELLEDSARRHAEIEAMFGAPAANGGGEPAPPRRRIAGTSACWRRRASCRRCRRTSRRCGWRSSLRWRR